MKEKKRILVLNYEFPPLGGGAGNATFYLFKEFSKNTEIKIDLITSSINKFRIEQFSDNITIHFLDIGKKGNLHFQSNRNLLVYSWKAYWYAKKLKKTEKFDLIHAFFGVPCGYIAMKLGLPYIVSLRGSDVPFYNKRFYWLDKLIFKRLSRKIWGKANKVIANSRSLKDLALKSKKDQLVEVIFNGVDIEEFFPNNNRKKKDKLVLISTGRLIARKGYQYLIDAISNLEFVELNLIGDGDLREELELKAKEVRANVKFLGKKDHQEISQFLRQADIFVLPSLNEGMSNSILEAMACGLPIIMTDTGGADELIHDNGFIIEKESVIELKQAIVNYVKDLNTIIKHRNNSRKIAEIMSWENVANKYLEIYES